MIGFEEILHCKLSEVEKSNNKLTWNDLVPKPSDAKMQLNFSFSAVVRSVRAKILFLRR